MQTLLSEGESQPEAMQSEQCCRQGQSWSGLSDLCCPDERRVLAMKDSAWLSRALHMGTHTFYHPSVITVVSCMCAGDSLQPPLLLLLWL